MVLSPTSPPSDPVFPLSVNVVNECYMKSLRPASCSKWTDRSVLGATTNPANTFERHLHSVSRAVSHRLGILRKSWRVFYDRLCLGRCFRGFVLPVLKYCSAV